MAPKKKTKPGPKKGSRTQTARKRKLNASKKTKASSGGAKKTKAAKKATKASPPARTPTRRRRQFDWSDFDRIVDESPLKSLAARELLAAEVITYEDAIDYIHQLVEAAAASADDLKALNGAQSGQRRAIEALRLHIEERDEDEDGGGLFGPSGAEAAELEGVA